MGSRGSQMGLVLVLVLVAVLWGGATAQLGCTSALTSLAPCLNYVTGNSSTPSSSCCSQLASVVKSSPLCLCSVLNGSGVSLGITVNQTLALTLPGACNVRTPPISQCKAANGPTTPATSPAGSPEAAIGPSASDTPSGSGSKTVPSTEGGSSDGNTAKAPIHLILFLGFIASCASTLARA